MTTITVTLTPPNPLTDSQATFNSKALAFTQALTPWAAQVNAVAGEVNANNAAAENSAAAAADSEVAAQGFAEDAADSAALAASSAGSAVNAPGTSATSTTSLAISSGSITLAIQTGKAFVVGQFVSVAATSSPANYMSGQITAHNSGAGSLTVNATQVNGSGTFAAWTIAVIGAPGAGSATGDILFTANALSAPAYLPCDGATYLKSSYPSLADKLGATGLFDDAIPIPSLPTNLTLSGTILSASWSPDSQYLLVASNSTPLRAVKRSGDIFSNLTISGATTSGYEAVFDKVDGTYIGEVGTNSPYVKFHKRTGDTFAQLGNPASLPSSACMAIDCSPDGVYWAATSTSSPFIYIYKRTGDTFTKLANPSTLPAVAGYSVSFSADGQFLAVSNRTNSPQIMLYQRSGDTFTAITSPGYIPVGADICQIKYDPTGRYLAAVSATTGSSFAYIYDLSNNWASRTLPILDSQTYGGLTNGRLAWASDGSLLAVPTYYGLAIFDARTNFTRIAGPAQGSVSASMNQTPSFSPDGQFLLFAGESLKARVWKRRYDPSTLFATPNISAGAKAYIKT